MRPDTASSTLWAAAFAAAVVAGLGTYTFVQVNNNAMSALNEGQIRQRLAAGAEPVPAPPQQPVEPAIPPASERPSPRPIGGKAEEKPEKGKNKEQRATPNPTPDQQVKTFSSSGGSLTAMCVGDTATLTRWGAAFGFFTENVVRGPATEVGVRFDKLDFGKPDVVVIVDCEKGQPEAKAFFPPDGDTTGGGRGDDDDRGESRGKGRGGFDD